MMQYAQHMQKTYSSFMKPPKTNDKVRSVHN